MKTEPPNTNDRYPWLRFWCQMLGSFEYYTQQEIAEAMAADLRETVIVVHGGPMYLESVTNPTTRKQALDWADKHKIEMPKVVIEAWNMNQDTL